MRSILLLGGSILCFAGLAQSFSGSIEFTYATQKDTTTNVYHVKDNMVKLDQYSRGQTRTIEGSYLFDLNAGEVKFLNSKRKLWGRQENRTPQNIRGNCVVSKGTATKMIAGIKCREYTVKNTDENTSITYWIAEDRYSFFIPLITLWNRPDKQSKYFAQLSDLKPGSMPLMSEEKALDTGKTLTRLEVQKITKTVPSEDIFMIPKDYSKFDQ